MLLLIIGFISWVALSFIIGAVSRARGSGFAVGFFLSLIFSPLIAILIILAMGQSKAPAAPQDTTQAAEGADRETPAAKAWLETQSSLQSEQYSDFLEAFRGTPEALLAAKHKRTLQEWDAVHKGDVTEVEAFLALDPFPTLKQRVRQFIADEAKHTTNFGPLNQRLLHEEAELERIASEEADRAKVAKLEQARQDASERGVRKTAIVLAFLIIGFVVMVIFALPIIVRGTN